MAPRASVRAWATGEAIQGQDLGAGAECFQGGPASSGAQLGMPASPTALRRVRPVRVVHHQGNRPLAFGHPGAPVPLTVLALGRDASEGLG